MGKYKHKQYKLLSKSMAEALLPGNTQESKVKRKAKSSAKSAAKNGKNGILPTNSSSNRAERNALGQVTKGNTVGKEYRWKKGFCPNPSGRPPRSILDQALEYELNRLVKVKKKKGAKADWKRIHKARQIAKVVLQQLLSGKKGMAQLVFERIGGKPLQQIEAKVEQQYTDPESRRQRIAQLQKQLALK